MRLPRTSAFALLFHGRVRVGIRVSGHLSIRPFSTESGKSSPEGSFASREPLQCPTHVSTSATTAALSVDNISASLLQTNSPLSSSSSSSSSAIRPASHVWHRSPGNHPLSSRPALLRAADILRQFRRLPRAVGAQVSEDGANGGVLVISGAGISTESGIPDYRSPGRPPYKPLQHNEFMSKLAVRQRYWARSMIGYPLLCEAVPATGHLALACMERLGVVRQLITQNVDRLHQRAGQSAVLELHGTVHEVECLHCRHSFSRLQMQRNLLALNARWEETFDVRRQSLSRPDGDSQLPEIDHPQLYSSFRIPECPNDLCEQGPPSACATNNANNNPSSSVSSSSSSSSFCCPSSLLKPKVVFHGGHVAPPVTAHARQLVSKSQALLVVGSTLTTLSAFSLVRAAHFSGTPVIILTKGPTRADTLHSLPFPPSSSSLSRGELVLIDEDIGEGLTALLSLL